MKKNEIVLCPCKSGKKYNECCELTGLLDFFKEQNLKYFDENYAFSNLFEKDQIFRNFYMQNRSKINKPVFYVKSNQMKSKASFGRIGDVGYFITTKYSKIPVSESIHIAHEIEHLVLVSEGFETAKLKNNNSPIDYQKFINDMIYDPKVNRELINYGYNLNEYLNTADSIQMKIIGRNLNHPGNEFLSLTLYVKKFLDYMNLNPNIKPEEIEFNKWIESHYPHLIIKSKHILGIIERNGTETPREARKTLIKIIAYLNLNDQLQIGN